LHSFHFYGSTVDTRAEVARARRQWPSAQGPDAALVACPVWPFLDPTAYQRANASRAERAAAFGQKTRLRHADEGTMNRTLQRAAAACRTYIDGVIWRRWPATRVFLLGLTDLRLRFRKMGLRDDVLSSLRRHIDSTLGLACSHDARGSSRLHSAHGITPLDREKIGGRRFRDDIHPVSEVQFAFAQLALNWLCHTF
jgi:hypothetical protein